MTAAMVRRGLSVATHLPRHDRVDLVQLASRPIHHRCRQIEGSLVVVQDPDAQMQPRRRQLIDHV